MGGNDSDEDTFTMKNYFKNQELQQQNASARRAEEKLERQHELQMARLSTQRMEGMMMMNPMMAGQQGMDNTNMNPMMMMNQMMNPMMNPTTPPPTNRSTMPPPIPPTTTDDGNVDGNKDGEEKEKEDNNANDLIIKEV